MGVVYEAHQRRLNRQVALKMIRAGGLARPDDRARFRIEAEAVAKLRHPNIIQIYDIGEVGGLPFVALELLEGGTLDAALGGTPQPGRPSATLVTTLARAVHAAHLADIVHRDLKPSNVLFTQAAFAPGEAASSFSGEGADEAVLPAPITAGEIPVDILLSDPGSSSQDASMGLQQVVELIPAEDSALALVATLWSLPSGAPSRASDSDPPEGDREESAPSSASPPPWAVFVIGLLTRGTPNGAGALAGRPSATGRTTGRRRGGRMQRRGAARVVMPHHPRPRGEESTGLGGWRWGDAVRKGGPELVRSLPVIGG